MTTLLFVGDIHLGRRPTSLAASGLDLASLSPAVAWSRAVDLALEQGLPVVLAGDVVDEERDRFEAYGHLERGVRRLRDAGLPVVAVAGNHDQVALPRLVERIEGMHLLGGGGRWERLELGDVDLFGWSFPTRHHTGNPIDAPGLQEALDAWRHDAAGLGVLHADLGAVDSPYAPVAMEDLLRTQLDAVLLGHIHRPDTLQGARPIGYLGALVGMNRSDLGPRGPWRVEASHRGQVRATQVPLGPVRFEAVQVDVSDMPPAPAAADHLHDQIAACVTEAAALLTDPSDAVGYALHFVGSTPHGQALQSFLAAANPDDLRFDPGGQPWAVVRMVDSTTPSLDLSALAQQATPLGAIAGLLLDLQTGGAHEILPKLGGELARFEQGRWAVEGTAALPDARQLATAAATRILLDLHSQQAES
jgi:DNA repair protein SbcD/Mre11